MIALRLILFLCTVRASSSATFDIHEPVVHWYENEITIYAETLEAVLILSITEPSMEDITVSLRAFGVGLSVTDDITIPETATIPSGRRFTDVIVQITNPDIVNVGTVGGNKLVRVRVEEVIAGKALLGDYHYAEIADVHLLGPSTTAACHSGSFTTSRIAVPEDIGTVYIEFMVNTPFPKDFEIGYTIDLHWYGAIHHAEHEVDYHYHVSHNHMGDDKYVILRAGETSVKIPISIIDDSKAEETEQFIVRLDHKCLSPFMNVLSDYVIIDIEDNDACTDTPHGSHEYKGICYFLVTDGNLTAVGARDDCKKYGGQLISVSNSIENAVAYELVPKDTAAWIGAERDPNNSAAFLWSDGSHVNYQSWATGEPDSQDVGKDCVFLRHDNQAVEWISEYCDGLLSIFSGLCEKNANPKS